MTAPVAQVALTPEPGAEAAQVWDVQFMMPAGSHPAALPVPDCACNSRVSTSRAPWSASPAATFTSAWP